MTTAAMMYESRYQRCREQQRTGWFHGQDLDDVLSSLTKRMQAERLPRTGRVLEMGCGAGDQSLLLAASGYDVAGVDIAPTSIAWANEKAAQRGLKADFRVGDVCDLNGFVDAGFDIVLDGNCLHFVIGDDRSKFLQSAYRVLKPGGWLLITSICCTLDDCVTAPGYDPATRCYMQDGIAYTYQGLADDIHNEVLTAGFKVVWQEVAPGVPDEAAAFLRLDARHA